MKQKKTPYLMFDVEAKQACRCVEENDTIGPLRSTETPPSREWEEQLAFVSLPASRSFSCVMSHRPCAKDKQPNTHPFWFSLTTLGPNPPKRKKKLWNVTIQFNYFNLVFDYILSLLPLPHRISTYTPCPYLLLMTLFYWIPLLSPLPFQSFPSHHFLLLLLLHDVLLLFSASLLLPQPQVLLSFLFRSFIYSLFMLSSAVLCYAGSHGRRASFLSLWILLARNRLLPSCESVRVARVCDWLAWSFVATHFWIEFWFDLRWSGDLCVIDTFIDRRMTVSYAYNVRERKCLFSILYECEIDLVLS